MSWDSLELQSGSFVDSELRQYHSDLLYAVRLAGRSTLVYLLLEHKSEPDVWMPLQMLVYVVRIWRRYREEHPRSGRLPPVIAIVVHHGTTTWEPQTDVRELVDMDSGIRADLAPYQPALRVLVDDLAQQTPRELAERAASALARLTLFCLQRARLSGDLIAELRPWRDAMRAVMAAPDGAAALAAVLSYIIRVQNPEPDTLRTFLRVELGPEAEETMSTTYDRLLNEARAEIVLQQLAERFGVVPTEVDAHVRAGSADELMTWARRLLAAATLEEVLASEPQDRGDSSSSP